MLVEGGSIPLYKIVISGGLAGGTGDMMMHCLDTVKTRLQGQPIRNPIKYQNMFHTFTTLIKEEGFRGLYGGLLPAMIGSVIGSTIYFATYETLKEKLKNLPTTTSHLASAGSAELIVSLIYVPSEVLKTRLQLQGKYNNFNFDSGYNYTSTWQALKTIVKNEGFFTLYKGYKITLLRDVPCTAIQFTIYEFLKSQFKKYDSDQKWKNAVLPELGIGAIAGAVAGGITTPLDVIKTVVQTQNHRSNTGVGGRAKVRSKNLQLPKVNMTLKQNLLSIPELGNAASEPVTSLLQGLRRQYTTLGVGGLFRGLAPRTVWTGAQSAIMFLVYEQLIASPFF